MIHHNQLKRQFLATLLNRYSHSEEDVNHLLKFIATQVGYIDTVVFSEHVKYAPRGIYISYANNSPVPFLYYRNGEIITDCQVAFHDFKLNYLLDKTPFYIEFNFPSVYRILHAMNIYEENEYAPDVEGIDRKVDESLYRLTLQTELSQLKQALNLALEQYDYNKAQHYADRINQLKGELHES